MKALVISHENGGTYVMDREGCFRFVKGHSSRPIGSEMELGRVSVINFNTLAAIAACLVLSLALSGFGILWNTESYSVYVDVNPSVELVFNNLNRLKAAKPLNEDGADLLEGLSLKGRPEEIVVQLIKAAEEHGYINEADEEKGVSITVVARGGKKPEDYQNVISAALAQNGMTNLAEVEVIDTDFRATAEEMGVSPGKLKLAEKLLACNPGGETLESALNMPVKDLMRMIKDAEGKGVPAVGNGQAAAEDKPGESPTNPNAGPGNNSGNTEKPSNPNAGPGNNNGNTEKPSNPNAGPGNNEEADYKNPNAGPGKNSGFNWQKNENAGAGNNSGNTAAPSNPNAGAGNNSGNTTAPSNPNAGAGNNSGKGGGGATIPSEEEIEGDANEDDTPIQEAESEDEEGKRDNPNKGPGNNSGDGDSDKEDNPNKGPGNNSGNGNGNADKEDNPNKGPGNNSGNDNSDKEDNPNKGPGNNSGNGNADKEDNPNKGPGNNSGNGNNGGDKDQEDKEDNPNKGAGNNSGNGNSNGDSEKEDNPNKGPGNNSGNDNGSEKEDNPNKGAGNNSGNGKDEVKEDNPNKGPGNNSGNDNGSEKKTEPDVKEDNPNKGSGNNSGNDNSEPKPDNPNKGPGNNNGNP